MMPASVTSVVRSCCPGLVCVFRGHLHIDTSLVAAPGGQILATWEREDCGK
jgi:hypothetical protein